MFESSAGVEIRLEHLSKIYPNTTVPAVEDFSLTIPAGDLVVFVGPSGCGKTTTMRLINRIIEPTSGRIFLGGNDVTATPGDELRRHIGYVIQQIGLFPHMTIEENIATVPRLLGWDRQRIRTRVSELLELVSLDPAKFAKRYPKQLSGGQQQRVGVARALAGDPGVLLMDEPFGASDPITRLRLQKEFRTIQQELGKTVVFVTHDFEEALLLGDRIAVLSDRSHVDQYGTPVEILSNPATDHVRKFVGQAARVRMLSLIPIDRLEGQPGEAQGAVTLDSSLTLSEDMDFFFAGDEFVNIKSESGDV
ncbi:MAG: ABC transporter ATP-binding protein, partial [Candidatus Nanopelagicales bacterium]